jgi:hypothetical protein
MREDPLSEVRGWRRQNDAIKGVQVQNDERTHMEEGATGPGRSGPGPAGPPHFDVGGPPISWAWRSFNPNSLWAPPFTREVIHKGERLERREIIREKDGSSPRRRPEVEEDVEAMPRHPQRRRKTPSKASPWSTMPCLASVNFSSVHGVVNDLVM